MVKRDSKLANDKSIDLDKKPSSSESPSNGTIAKSRKRHAPSGVSKIKLIAEQTIKQAVDQAVLRNETLA